MNSAILNVGFEIFRIPARAASKSQAIESQKPIAKLDDQDDGIQNLHVLDSVDYLPVPTPLPEKRHPVLDVDRMVVSASMIRRIEHELKHDDCDPRTVFNFCRGLKRGSLEFEDAYISARIQSFAKHQRICTDPLPGARTTTEYPFHNPCLATMNQITPPPPHPMAVNHPGHLMSHLGIWVIGLLTIQVWASWRIGVFANTYLEGGRLFYFAIALVLFLAVNSAVWFRRRGRLFDAFLFPGAVLFLMALLPILILHVRGTLLAMN